MDRSAHRRGRVVIELLVLLFVVFAAVMYRIESDRTR